MGGTEQEIASPIFQTGDRVQVFSLGHPRFRVFGTVTGKAGVAENEHVYQVTFDDDDVSPFRESELRPCGIDMAVLVASEETSGLDTEVLDALREHLDKEHVDTRVLDAASAAVMGDRAHDYGSPTVNHGRTAQMWSLYLGVEITARQVCMLNILQKISRDSHRAKRDNLVDIAGYAQNASWVSPA